MTNSEGNKGAGKLPEWDGSGSTWQKYLLSVKWHFNGLKKNDRPMAASRLARRLLSSDNASVRRLIMKLDPDKFTSVAAVRKLLTYLENSPLGQMPVPDAGVKMGTYYRKLQRRRGETVGAFLVRKDHAYDEMKNALEKLVDQQLGAKKEATAASWRTPRRSTERDYGSPERRGGTPARDEHENRDDEER